MEDICRLYFNWHNRFSWQLDEIPTRVFLKEFGNIYTIENLIHFKDNYVSENNSSKWSEEYLAPIEEYIHQRQMSELIKLWK